MRGDSNERDRSGRFVVHAVWHRVKPLLIDGREFGERPLPPQQSLVRPPNAIARLEPRGPIADRFDDAGEIATDDERIRCTHVNGAAADVDVDRVEGGRGDLHKHLPRGWRRRWQFADDDFVGRTRLVDIRGAHGVFSWLSIG